MDIKNKIERLNVELEKSINKDIISKLSEVKGLYSAYEISRCAPILESVLDKLLDLLKVLNDVPSTSTMKAILNKENKTGALSGFYEYLISEGKIETTANNYRKALNQVVVAQKLSGIEELENRLIEMINFYDGNDQAAHNAHTAALKQYSKYINRGK